MAWRWYERMQHWWFVGGSQVANDAWRATPRRRSKDGRVDKDTGILSKDGRVDKDTGILTTMQNESKQMKVMEQPGMLLT
jgi:hypothetical protein